MSRRIRSFKSVLQDASGGEAQEATAPPPLSAFYATRLGQRFPRLRQQDAEAIGALLATASEDRLRRLLLFELSGRNVLAALDCADRERAEQKANDAASQLGLKLVETHDGVSLRRLLTNEEA